MRVPQPPRTAKALTHGPAARPGGPSHHPLRGPCGAQARSGEAGEAQEAVARKSRCRSSVHRRDLKTARSGPWMLRLARRPCRVAGFALR